MPVKLEAIVDSIEDLSSTWRRVRLRHAGFADFGTFDGIHLKIEVQPDDDNAPPVSRVYTIAAASGALVDIDVFLHGDGPGARWAKGARLGDAVNVSGPVGRRPVAPADWFLLATDEAGLPALRRIFDHVGPSAAGKAYALVDGPADRLPLTVPKDVDLEWIYRNGNGDDALVARVRDTTPPAGEAIFCWCAAEARTVKTIGQHWASIGIQSQQMSCGAYWRRD